MKALVTNTSALGLALALASVGAAMSEETRRIDISASDMSAALAELSAETGISIIAARIVVSGLASPRVTGEMTPRRALDALLAGTDLFYRDLGNDRIVVEQFEFGVDVTRGVENDPFDLGTIVLRGELIDRDIQNSQTSAVVEIGEDLEARGETNLNQVINRTPGTSISNTDVVIRGVRSSGIGTDDGAGASLITTSLDGIRLSDFEDVSETDVSTWDLEQVEILRGPQSTQTGRNALFGSVVLQSRDPQFFPEYRFQAGLGNYDSYQLAFALNQPLIDDRLAVRFSFDKRETDGFFNNEAGTNDRAAFNDVETYRLGVRYDPTDRISTVFKYTYIEDRGSSIRGGTEFLPDRIVRSEDARQHDIQSLNAELNFELSDALKLTSNTIYTTADPSTDRIFRSGFSNRNRSYDVFEQELRLSYETDRTRAVIGAFYTSIDDENLVTQTDTLLTGIPFPIGPDAVRESRVLSTRTTDNYALFGEIEHRLSPSWTLIAGARYDVEEYEANSSDTIVINDAGVITPLPVNVDPEASDTFEAFLPKAGVIYQFDDDRSLGLTYQRGYRAGGSGINIGPSFEGDPVETFTFEPEFTDTFELAYRSQFNDGRTTFNANIFYTEYDDIQVLQRQESFFDVVIVNGGSARLWGAEAEFSTLVTPDLEVYASAAFTDTKYGNFSVLGVDFSGDEFIYAPRLSATIGGSFSFGNGWRVAADASYTDETFNTVPNDAFRPNDDYWLINGQVSYAINESVNVTGYVRNLLDEDYTTSVGALSAFIGPPREFGVFLNATF